MPPEVARFHVSTGPAALFARVGDVFDGPRALRVHGDHLAERVTAATPMWALDPFVPADWELVLVEARTDTGKFVNTTWRRTVDGVDWWVVIGYRNTVRTFYPADPGKTGMGPSVVVDGPTHDLADRVNRALRETS
jgi:hypothetical protein